MSTAQPLVSVILPVYNAGAVVKESITSIVNQKYRNLEIIICNDGSSDNSESVIKKFNDPRIRYFHNNENKGLIKSLNASLKLAQGDLIARMDADDVAHPERIIRQVNYFRNHRDVAVAGTAMNKFGATAGRSRVTTDSDQLSAELLFRIPFNHPTVMMRRTVIEKYTELYDHRFPHAEDLELWHRLAPDFKFGNINYPLLSYRTHAQQVTSLNAERLNTTVTVIMKTALQKLTSVNENELHLHMSIYRFDTLIDKPFQNYVEWLEKLYHSNSERKIFPVKTFEQVLAHKLNYIRSEFIKAGISTAEYKNSILSRKPFHFTMSAIMRRLKRI